MLIHKLRNRITNYRSLITNTQTESTMKNTENKYWFNEVSQNISAQLIEVECYDLNTDEKVATIELKYIYDEYDEEWKVESSEFHTNPTIKEISDLVEELKYRASNEFHEFCYECSMYEEFNEDKWFI